MSRSHITSHVLDAALGAPARDVMIRLERGTPASSAPSGEGADGAPSLTWEQIGSQRTDEDQHYHEPVLLSPVADTPSRGS